MHLEFQLRLLVRAGKSAPDEKCYRGTVPLQPLITVTTSFLVEHFTIIQPSGEKVRAILAGSTFESKKVTFPPCVDKAG